jgi:hypothetical protein
MELWYSPDCTWLLFIGPLFPRDSSTNVFSSLSFYLWPCLLYLAPVSWVLVRTSLVGGLGMSSSGDPIALRSFLLLYELKMHSRVESQCSMHADSDSSYVAWFSLMFINVRVGQSTLSWSYTLSLIFADFLYVLFISPVGKRIETVWEGAGRERHILSLKWRDVATHGLVARPKPKKSKIKFKFYSTVNALNKCWYSYISNISIRSICLYQIKKNKYLLCGHCGVQSNVVLLYNMEETFW